MTPNLYIGNGCFTKHPFFNGCLGFQSLVSSQLELTGAVRCWFLKLHRTGIGGVTVTLYLQISNLKKNFKLFVEITWCWWFISPINLAVCLLIHLNHGSNTNHHGYPTYLPTSPPPEMRVTNQANSEKRLDVAAAPHVTTNKPSFFSGYTWSSFTNTNWSKMWKNINKTLPNKKQHQVPSIQPPFEKNCTCQTYLTQHPNQTILISISLGSQIKSLSNSFPQHQPLRQSVHISFTKSRFNFISLTKYRSRNAFSLRKIVKSVEKTGALGPSWSNNQASSNERFEPRERKQPKKKRAGVV